MTNTTNNTRTKTQKTVNGIQKLFRTGKYRVQKTINGTRYQAYFSKRRDAVKYLGLLMDAKNKVTSC